MVIPHSIKTSNNIWNKIIKNDLSISAITVNHGAIPAIAWRVESHSCAITFSGDMNGSSENLPKLAKNTHILLANNAIPQHASTIAKYRHMTPLKIGELASRHTLLNSFYHTLC